MYVHSLHAVHVSRFKYILHSNCISKYSVAFELIFDKWDFIVKNKNPVSMQM